MNIFNIFRTSASALTAQRFRLDTVANNIANIETTRTDEGGPYRKQSVVFNARSSDQTTLPRYGPIQRALRIAGGFGRIPAFQLPALVKHRSRLLENPMPRGGVEVIGVVPDNTSGPRVYDPGHPDADEDGYVARSNVDLVTEMTDMLSATRSYEANITVLNSAKQMAQKALEIGSG